MNFIFNKVPFLAKTKNVTLIFCALVAIATIHRLWLGEHSFNNFTIFRYSFYNLTQGNNLYLYHTDQYNDLYKYSPTFAMLMAPFWWMPRTAGLFIFNLLNVLLPFRAVSKLKISERNKCFILLFVAIELLSSIQNAQSNGIMTGLIVGAFVFFERKNVMMAALFICLGFYIKIFAAFAGILFFFYEEKWKFILWCAFFGILLAVMPVIITGYEGLIMQYKGWYHLLASDPAHELNFSVMTLTQRWFNFTLGDVYYLVPGMLLLFIPMLRSSQWKNYSWRLLLLGTILVWVVIFNHKAESPTYVVAVTGVAIAALMERNLITRRIILWSVFIFTTLSPTDIFPKYVREHFWQPYCLIALPCILAWMWFEWKLLREEDPALQEL